MGRTTIELWLVDLEACAPALEALERDTPRLADDEREKAGAIADPRERRHRLAAYVALRLLLERMAGPDVRCRPFLRGPGGKPGLGESGIEFSLSHTDGLALVGVARGLTIGVDLERARPVKMSARRYAEIYAIGAGLGGRHPAGAGMDRAFVQAWARLEAFTKARGRGLAGTLADLGLRGQGRRVVPVAQLRAAARRLVARAGFTVRDVALPPGLHGALAAPRGTPPVRPRPFPTDRAEAGRLLEHGP